MGKNDSGMKDSGRGRAAHRWRRFTRRLWRAYYAFKYMPFRLEQPTITVPMERRGFVCIQIDSLAREHLLQAMRNGYMRTLRRMLRRGRATLHDFQPGLPTSTSYAQAGILFGMEEDIPGFRWYEKSEQRIVNCNYPESVQYIRDKIIGDRPGALEGGSSYANLLDGGAQRMVFTVAGSRNESILAKLGGKHLLFLLVFHPVRVLRLAFASFIELWVEAYDRWLRPEPHAEQAELEGLFPLLRVASNVVLRELQTLGLLADIHAGMPYIFTTYGGYDELAHHFGPTSRAAMTNLRYIDRRIAEVSRMIRFGATRQYDLIILSDHGQTPATPFARRFGQTLGAEIAEHLRDRPVQESRGPEQPWGEGPRYLTREVEASRLARLPGVERAARAVERRSEKNRRRMGFRPETSYADGSAPVVVTYSSCLAHVYILADKAPMNEARIAELYPGLIPHLRRHEGIGPLFVRMAAGGWRVLDAESSAELTEGRLRNVIGLDPMRHIDPSHRFLPQLWRFLNFRNVGDIVLFGRYDGRRIYCFDDQVGAHGTMGGPQDQPFLMLPAGHPATQATLRGYGAIYREILMPYSGRP